jgi:L-gulonate 5-dehydrogenase
VGKPNVCTSLVVLGVHRDGGFSEYAVVPAKNAWQVPDNVTDRHAVMIEPFTIAANVTGHVSPTDQDIALVYGAGPMGLTTIQVLKGCIALSRSSWSIALMNAWRWPSVTARIG